MADLSDAANWFETDASNNKGPPNGWPEGMMPSAVNDTARADRGALKRFWNRANPVQEITASGGLYQFTTDSPAYPASYAYGEVYIFTAITASVGGDQFQVNALGAKPIYVMRNTGPVLIAAGEIINGRRPQLVYDNSLNAGSGGFMLLNPFVPIASDGAGGTSIPGSLGVTGSLGVAGNLGVTGALDAGATIQSDGTGNAFYTHTGLIKTDYNGSGSGGEAIYATAGGIRSDSGGTALYLPNGDISCQNITAAGTGPGTSGVAIHCMSGAVQSDHFGTAFYAPNGDLVCQNVTAAVQGFKPGGGSWAAISDVRLKEDVWRYAAGLAEVMALRPVSYCFNGRGGTVRDGRRYIGLVADEVEGVMPEMVGTMSRMLDPDDDAPSEIKTLDTTALIFALVNCCQELTARVASLEADVRD